MTIKVLKENIRMLQEAYLKNKLNKNALSRHPKILQLKSDILNSGLSFKELSKHLPLELQLQIDMLLVPDQKSFLTISQFKSLISHSDDVSKKTWQLNKKLAKGNIEIPPFNQVFADFQVHNGKLVLAPLNPIELAKLNITNSPIPVNDLSERQLLSAFCATIPYKNNASRKMIEAITFVYENGDKDVALYNAAILSILVNQLKLKILEHPIDSFYFPLAKIICIGKEDGHSACLHELGHAIHHLLYGHVMPPDFNQLYNISQEQLTNSPETIQVLANALNLYHQKNKKVRNEVKSDIEDSLEENNLRTVIKVALNSLSKEELIRLVYDNVAKEDQFPYLQMVDTDIDSAKSFLEKYLFEKALSQITNAHYDSDEFSGFSLDALSGIIQGVDYQLQNGETIQLDIGHSGNYYVKKPYHAFPEMFANYNVCRAYGDKVAIKQLQDVIGSEMLNYVENLYDGYLSGIYRDRKFSYTPLQDYRTVSFEECYAEAISTTNIDDSVKANLTNSLNQSIYKDEYQVLYSLLNYLMRKYRYDGTIKHLLNFLANPNYFRENEEFENQFTEEFLSEMDEINYGSLKNFLLLNFPNIQNDEAFIMISQEHNKNKDNRTKLYKGEIAYKLINGICIPYYTYYTSFGTKIFLENPNALENVELSFEIFFLRCKEFPTSIKEVIISKDLPTTLDGETLMVTNFHQVSDELLKYADYQKKY